MIGNYCDIIQILICKENDTGPRLLKLWKMFVFMDIKNDFTIIMTDEDKRTQVFEVALEWL